MTKDLPIGDQVNVLQLRLDSFIDGREKHDRVIDIKLGTIESSLSRILEKQEQSRETVDSLVDNRLTKAQSDAKERFMAVESDVHQLQSATKPNWAVIVTGIGVMFTMISGIAVGAVAWVHSDITTMVQPLAGSIATLSTLQGEHSSELNSMRDAISKSSSADENSRTDRVDLNRRAEVNAAHINDLDKQTASMKADIASFEKEVETQVDATGQALGIQFAEQARKNNQFASALSNLGAKFPSPLTDPYTIPNISNRSHPVRP